MRSMHEKLTSAIVRRAVPQLSFPSPMIRMVLGYAGKGRTGTVKERSEAVLLGMTEISRRNIATGSVRHTAVFLELRASDNAIIDGNLEEQTCPIVRGISRRQVRD